jgi:hypothetical protein
MRKQDPVISEYAQMWPRNVYDFKDGKKTTNSLRQVLHLKPGVYVLYRDEHPYYIGKTTKSLFGRIRDHALNVNDRYYNFWNHFSAFVVPNVNHIDEIEGILIASVAITSNSSTPKIAKIKMPKDIAERIKAHRAITEIDSYST